MFQCYIYIYIYIYIYYDISNIEEEYKIGYLLNTLISIAYGVNQYIYIYIYIYIYKYNDLNVRIKI